MITSQHISNIVASVIRIFEMGIDYEKYSRYNFEVISWIIVIDFDETRFDMYDLYKSGSEKDCCTVNDVQNLMLFTEYNVSDR